MGFQTFTHPNNQLIQEMIDILDFELGYTNIIVLAIDGTTPRFSSGLLDMMKQMTSIFGHTWWDYLMIGVTKWKYSQAAIDERQNNCDYYGDPSENCKNEAWFKRELLKQIEENFGQTRDFEFAFMDSFSQSGGPNQNDQVQQQHWIEETNKTWQASTTGDGTFSFLTIDDILEEHEICLKERESCKEEKFACEKQNQNLTGILDSCLEWQDGLTAGRYLNI